MSTEIEIPEGCEVRVEANQLFIKSEKGEINRKFPSQKMSIKVEGNKIIIDLKFKDARTRALLGTFRSHIKNMFAGLKEEFVYKLRICSIHFPMNVQVKGNELVINNFLGGKRPKIVEIPAGADVSVDGDIITVKSIDKELAGIIATRIEQITRLTGRDRRIFQDGIYIIEKAGKEIK